MSTYGIPHISELILQKYRLKEWWRGVGVAGFVDCIWDPGIPHMERNSTESEKQMWPNESVGESVSERLMYATAVLQGNAIQTFLLSPQPQHDPPAPRSPPSASLMSWTVRQGIPAPFVVFKEELGGRSGGLTLGKVTDERAVEGGGQVALKRVGGIGKIDHRGLKYPLKDPRLARKSQQVTSHDRETHEKARDQEIFGTKDGRSPSWPEVQYHVS